MTDKGIVGTRRPPSFSGGQGGGAKARALPGLDPAFAGGVRFLFDPSCPGRGSPTRKGAKHGPLSGARYRFRWTV